MNRRNSLILTGLILASSLVTGIYYSGRSPSQNPAKKVLVVLPLTGPAASWGEHFKRGADMFIRTERRPLIEVRVIDSQGNPAVAMSAVQQACVSGKPYAIVSTLSSITVPVKNWSEKEGIFLVACVITDKVLQGPGKVQRVYPSVESNARPLARYCKSRFKRVAVLNSNEELGIAVRRTFERDYVGDDRAVIVSESYQLKDTEVRSIVAKVVQPKPEAILVTGIGPAFWSIIRELRTQEYPGQILSDASFADPVQIKDLGVAAEGIVFLGSETELDEPRTAEAQQFKESFHMAFDAPPNYTGVTVYESLRMLNKIAESAPALTSDSFPSLGEWPGVPGPVRFLAGGDCDYPWFLMTHQNGKTIPVEE